MRLKGPLVSGKSKQPYSRDIRQGSQPPSQPASILGHTDSLAVGKVLPQMKTWGLDIFLRVLFINYHAASSVHFQEFHIENRMQLRTNR